MTKILRGGSCPVYLLIKGLVSHRQTLKIGVLCSQLQIWIMTSARRQLIIACVVVKQQLETWNMKPRVWIQKALLKRELENLKCPLETTWKSVDKENIIFVDYSEIIENLKVL